jgi:hypothetical protein
MALFDVLDDYLLVGIAKYLLSPLDIALRATCKRMRALIRAPLGMTREELLLYGARNGDVEVCKLARELGIREYYAHNMTQVAAMNNHVNVCMFAREWLAKMPQMYSANNDYLLYGAARGGHRALCELALNGGVFSYQWLMLGAAEGHHIDLCEWAIELTPVDQSYCMLMGAAQGGHRDLCIRAREMSGIMIACNDMMRNAASRGHREICELAREWGARNYGEMLIGAAECGNREICELARKWSTQPLPLDLMFDHAFINGQYDICDLANKWGCTRKWRA